MTLAFEPNRSLKALTTFGIGGEAELFVEVRTIEDMQAVLQQCQKEQRAFFILGKGSNILFDDRGFKGVVILNKIDFFEANSNTFRVGAGFSFSLLGTKTARAGWSGLEFASGIPASVGGAVWMNAGANGRETADVLTAVEFVKSDGTLCLFKKEDLEFSYRYSSFQTMNGAIVAAHFQLSADPTARQKQKDILDYRLRTQPYSEKSAGCIFRNPSCGHAGALIETSRLKGMKMGGAEVSTLHANFIVNKDNATSQDVLQLIDHIRQVVKEKTGSVIDQEMRYIPFDGGQ